MSIDPALMRARELRQAKLEQRELDGTLPEFGYVNVDGQLVPDPVPLEPPVGYVAQPSVIDQVLERLQARARMLQEDEEIDTAEDLEDFGPEDDDFPASPHELTMAEEFPDLRPAPPEPVPPAPEAPIQPEAPAAAEPAPSASP